jgi:AraC-like DNA-binding protein
MSSVCRQTGNRLLVSSELRHRCRNLSAADGCVSVGGSVPPFIELERARQANGNLSSKQIAARVGYSRTSELDAHFRDCAVPQRRSTARRQRTMSTTVLLVYNDTPSCASVKQFMSM